jgi:DNA-binding GntR family transcriptional regulator
VSSGSFHQIRLTSLRDEVVRQIRQAIIEGRLKPGDHIVEKNLTSELRVSRTPVREALILLEREGLVVSEPNRGSFVRVFSVDDVTYIFSMRTVLENFAAELIVDKLEQSDYDYLRNLVNRQHRAIESGDFKQVRSIDMSFHEFFIERSEHPLLMRMWMELVAQIAALLFMRAEAIPDYDEFLAVADHGQILAAYEARDLEAAKAENARINDRVASECRRSIQMLRAM